MPILLTTAFNPGDIDPGKTYAQAKITWYRTHITQMYMEVHCELGNTVEGVWTPGATQDYIFPLAGEDFIALCSAVPEEGETVYQTVSRLLYQWLLDEGKFIGTIV